MVVVRKSRKRNPIVLVPEEKHVAMYQLYPNKGHPKQPPKRRDATELYEICPGHSTLLTPGEKEAAYKPFVWPNRSPPLPGDLFR